MPHLLQMSAATSSAPGAQAARSAAQDAQPHSDAQPSLPAHNTYSYALPKSAPLNNIGSAEGSNGLVGAPGAEEGPPGPLGKRRRISSSK